MSFSRFRFGGLLRRFRDVARTFGETVRAGYIRFRTELPIREPTFDLGTFTSRIRADLILRGLPSQPFVRGTFVHTLESDNLADIILRDNELVTHQLLLIGPNGESLIISVRGPYGRVMSQDELMRAVRSAVWDVEGETVLGSGLRPTEWVRLASITMLNYRTTFVRG